MHTATRALIGFNFNAETLHMGKSGSITGVISLHVGDVYFPEREWSDFPVRILQWWLTELSQLWRGEPETAEGVTCAFMDGAFYYSVSARDSDCWLIECVDDIPDGNVVAEAEVDRAMFMKELATCAKEILVACRAHSWRTKDIDELAATLGRVESETIMQTA